MPLENVKNIDTRFNEKVNQNRFKLGSFKMIISAKDVTSEWLSAKVKTGLFIKSNFI